MMNPEPKVDRLLQNMEQLFVEGQNSDIILKVQDREFPVHKAILIVRSPVFSCMFSHKMAETFSGVVHISDCSVEAFEVLLLFLYTGRVNTITTENVFDVYYVADKYSIDDLKDHIIQFLKANISVESFCYVFALSMRHSDVELQNITANFFSKNMSAVRRTHQWKKYAKENPMEVNTLFGKTLQCLYIAYVM